MSPRAEEVRLLIAAILQGCAMAEENVQKRKILLTLAGLVCVMSLVALALKFDLLAGPKPLIETTPQTVTFKDGGKLEILGVSVGERVVEVSPRKSFLLRFFSRKGSSGGTYGGLNIDTENEDGRIIRCRLHSDSPTAMLMEFRMTESSGREMKLASYLTQRNWVLKDERIGGMRGSSGFIEAKDDSLPTLLAEMAKVGLQVLIQHRDPQSGWVNFMGPSMYYEPWPGRYIAVLTAWQRNLPTLECRAICEDGEVAEFSIANPDFRKSPTLGTVKTLPIVHTAHDYSLTLRKVERFRAPGEHPFAAVEMDLAYKGPPVRGMKNGPVMLSSQGTDVSDEWGNVTNVRSESIGKNSKWGAFLPAESKRMTFNIQVARSESYPRDANDGFTVLAGVVSADGGEINFKPGPDAALFGITVMPVCPIKPAKSGRYGNAMKDWKELQFEIGGENNAKAMEVIRKQVGDEYMQWTYPIFAGESDESVGLTDGPLSGGGGGGINRDFNFKMDFRWLLPPELLAPSAKIRVGIHRKLKHDDLSFDLELPSTIQPR
jgi:hypothetical protein